MCFSAKFRGAGGPTGFRRSNDIVNHFPTFSSINWRILHLRWRSASLHIVIGRVLSQASSSSNRWLWSCYMMRSLLMAVRGRQKWQENGKVERVAWKELEEEGRVPHISEFKVEEHDRCEGKFSGAEGEKGSSLGAVRSYPFSEESMGPYASLNACGATAQHCMLDAVVIFTSNWSLTARNIQDTWKMLSSSKCRIKQSSPSSSSLKGLQRLVFMEK